MYVYEKRNCDLNYCDLQTPSHPSPFGIIFHHQAQNWVITDVLLCYYVSVSNWSAQNMVPSQCVLAGVYCIEIAPVKDDFDGSMISN